MAMTLLKARKLPNNTFHVHVHLDDTKLVDGQLDPAWVREYTWSPTPQGMTQAAYVTQLKAETKLLCQQELAAMAALDDEGTALPGEGQTL